LALPFAIVGSPPRNGAMACFTRAMTDRQIHRAAPAGRNTSYSSSQPAPRRESRSTYVASDSTCLASRMAKPR
jgi:hypothetical protein